MKRAVAELSSTKQRKFGEPQRSCASVSSQPDPSLTENDSTFQEPDSFEITVIDTGSPDQCPVCGGSVESGRLFGQNMCLKWLPTTKSLFLGIWAIGGVRVGWSGWRFVSERARVYGVRCLQCGRIVIEPDQIGVERIPLNFNIRSLLIMTGIAAGGCAGFVVVSELTNRFGGAFFGFPLGATIGWLIGLGILLGLERLLEFRADKVRLKRSN